MSHIGKDDACLGDMDTHPRGEVANNTINGSPSNGSVNSQVQENGHQVITIFPQDIRIRVCLPENDWLYLNSR